MAIRTGSFAAIAAALFLMAAGLSVLYLGTDGSDATEGDYGNFHWVMDDGKNLTVTGHGDLETFQSGWSGLVTLTLVPDGTVNIGNTTFEDCDSLTTVTVNGPVGTIGGNAFSGCDSLTSVTIDGSVGYIGGNAFYDCGSLTSVTIDGFVGIIGGNAFYDCGSLTSVTVNCVMDIEAGSSDYGGIAKNATTVNKLHAYSSSYEWADDGSSCTVHIVCANTSDHNHDVTDAVITSTVKIQPTETEKGTTEYTVSGTYDGYAYSDTKDIQDIPATGGGSGGGSDDKDDNALIYIAAAVIAVLAIAGGALLFIRHR